ncbi:hypothetical protein AX16_004665 [Volvariella volvacea WC 439]|nr:hypothetical protein AX16_004665 [Volvariella volvacea WC 439]
MSGIERISLDSQPPTIDAPEPHLEVPFTINALPIEVLCKIFKDVVPDYLSWETPEDRHQLGIRGRRYCTPTVIAQVCQHWRSIAVADPTLWSTITVRGAGWGALKHVQLYLARSGPTCLLDIKHSCFERHLSWSAGGLEAIIKLFTDNISRWRRVRFSYYKYWYPTLLHAAASATNMVSASFKFHYWGYQDFLDVWRLLEGSPALRELQLFDWDALHAAYSFGPWNRLTRLRLPSLEERILLDILKQSPNLKELWVKIQHAYHSNNFIPVVLPNLTDLYILSNYTTHANTLLRRLETPSLRHLNLYRRHNRVNKKDVFNPDGIHDFLLKSQCQLQRLVLDDYFLGDSDLAKLFNNTSKLTSLQELVLNAMGL